MLHLHEFLIARGERGLITAVGMNSFQSVQERERERERESERERERETHTNTLGALGYYIFTNIWLPTFKN